MAGRGNGTREESWLDKGAGRVGVEQRTDAVDSGDSSREDRVQRRRLSQDESAFQLLCGIFASNPR